MMRCTRIHSVLRLIVWITLLGGCAATCTDSYYPSCGSAGTSEFFTCEEVIQCPPHGVAFHGKASVFRLKDSGSNSKPSVRVTGVALWREQKGKVGRPELTKLDEQETPHYDEPPNPWGQNYISCNNCCQTARWDILCRGRWKVQWYLNGTAAGFSEFVVR